MDSIRTNTSQERSKQVHFPFLLPTETSENAFYAAAFLCVSSFHDISTAVSGKFTRTNSVWHFIFVKHQNNGI